MPTATSTAYTSYEGQITNIVGRRSYRRDPFSGWSTTWEFSGEEADMTTKANNFGIGWGVDLKQDDAGVWNLTATFPGFTTSSDGNPEENPTENWDLTYEVSNKNLLDTALGTIPLIPDFICKAIKDALKDQNDTILVQTVTYAYNHGQLTADQINATYLAYHHMQKGFNHVEQRVPILIRTAYASSIWSVPWTDAVDSSPVILTTQTLTSQEDVSENLHLRLPTDVYQNVNVLNSVKLQWGWWRRQINKSSTIGARAQVAYTQQFKYGLWPTAYFGNPS